jgi:hypothetical protein
LDAKLLEEEVAIMEGLQNTDEGKATEEVHKENDAALERLGAEEQTKRETARQRIHERRAALLLKQQQEMEAARQAEETLIAKKVSEICFLVLKLWLTGREE